MIWSYEVQVESKGVGNVGFHFQYFFTFVGIVGNVNKFICARRCDLEKFGGDECTCTVCNIMCNGSKLVEGHGHNET